MRHIGLSNLEIHVWEIHHRAEAVDEGELTGVLSQDERERAGRHRFSIDRLRFVTARVWLRRLLEEYGVGEARGIRFIYSERGKPRLVAENNPKRVEFNVSHSGDVIVMAFAMDRWVGIDVEEHRDVPEMEEITERVFSKKEKGEFGGMGQKGKETAFFKGWTRKEAVLKALGGGLDDAMQQVSVGLDPVKSRREIRLDIAGSQEMRLSVVDLELGPEYSGAVAFVGDGETTIRRFVVQGDWKNWSYVEQT